MALGVSTREPRRVRLDGGASAAPILPREVAVMQGNRSALKSALLNYCFAHFEEEDIWLIDSSQVFDPYYLSSVNVARTRGMLYRIQVSRPFTFYQLRDKIHSLTRIPLSSRSTIIISGLDRFKEDLRDHDERCAIMGEMVRVLDRVQKRHGCKMILGVSDAGMIDEITDLMGEVHVWEGPSFPSDMKSRPSLPSFVGVCSV